MLEIDKRKGYDPVTILIYDRKRGVQYQEISLIAIEKATGKVVATGNEAEQLPDRLESNVVVLCPLKNGMIADYMAAQAMFRQMLQKASVLRPVLKPRMAVCVPAGLTEVERRAFQEVFYQAGAKEVSLSEESVENTNQTLPSSYEILIGIIQNKKSGQIKKEMWEEVCRGKIPAGIYRLDYIKNQEPETVIALSSQKGHVDIQFHNAAAVRLLAKGAVPDGLYAEGEIEQFRKNQFKNIIYQIEGGEFYSFVTGKDRGKAGSLYWKHYLIISEEHAIEVLAEKEPDIIEYQ